MADEKKVLIDVEIQNQKAVKNILDLKKQLIDLRKQQTELKNSGKENTAAYEVLGEQIKVVNGEIRGYQSELRNSIKEQNAATGSIEEMRAEVALLRRSYTTMSAEIRESETGQAVANDIKKLTDAIKEAEGAVGNFRDNVGDYENAINRALASTVPFPGVLKNLGLGVDDLSGAFTTAKTGVNNFGKALLNLLKNPIVLIIAGIVLILKKLADAIKGNEELTSRFQGILSQFEPVIRAVGVAFEFVAGALATLIEWLIKGAAYIGDWITGTDKLTESVNRQAQAQRDRLQLEKDVRANQILSAKTAREVANLQANIADKENYTAKQRLEMLDRVSELERKQAEENKRIAEEQLRLLKEKQRNSKASTEAAQELAAAEVAVIQTETELDQVLRGVNKSRSQLLQTIKAETDAAVEAGERSRKEALKTYQDVLKLDLDLWQARFDAQTAGQEKTFTSSQAYADRVFAENERVARLDLQAQLDANEITQTQYDKNLQILIEKRKKFNADQSALVAEYQKNLRGSIVNLIEQSIEQQIDSINRKYDQAVKALGELTIPVRTLQTEEEFEAELNDYARLVENYEATILELEKSRLAETNKARTEDRAKLERELDEANTAIFGAELEKYTDNERKKLEVSTQALRELIEARRAAGFSSYEEEAKLRAQLLALEKINVNNRVALADTNSKEIFNAKKTYLLAEADLYRDNADMQIQIMAELRDLERDYLQQRVDEYRNYADQVLSTVSELSGVFDNLDSAELQRYTEKNNEQKRQLENRLNAGLITQKQYNTQVAKLDEGLAEKKKEINQKQAKREKALKTFEIIINTQAAIVKALPNVVLAALAGAMGAASLIKVLSEPLPQAAKGRLIHGKSHKQGGELIEAEAGEVIINKRSSSMFMPLLSAINQAGGGVPFTKPFSDGGFAARGAVASAGGFSSSAITDAVIEGLESLSIQVAVEDIRREDAKFAQVTQRATF